MLKVARCEMYHSRVTSGSQNLGFLFNTLLFHRYIVHSDDHNPYLDSMEEFEKRLQNFKPDLMVVGGLQMMDNFPFKHGSLSLRQALH